MQDPVEATAILTHGVNECCPAYRFEICRAIVNGPICDAVPTPGSVSGEIVPGSAMGRCHQAFEPLGAGQQFVDDRVHFRPRVTPFGQRETTLGAEMVFSRRNLLRTFVQLQFRVAQIGL